MENIRINISYKRKINLIVIILSSSLIFFAASIKPVNAGMDIGIFGGLSGTSTVIFLADYFGDMEGSLVDEASKYGLITGEIGLGIDLNFSHLGLKLEGLIGYYKYRVLHLPNTAYIMYMAGAEAYISSEEKGRGYTLGAGYGKFNGSQWDEILGQEVTVFKKHKGYAIWGSIGHKWENFEINGRVRYHKFTNINRVNLENYEGKEYEKLRDDYVFVLRFCLWFNII